jgi:hypothetical protein
MKIEKEITYGTIGFIGGSVTTLATLILIPTINNYLNILIKLIGG